MKRNQAILKARFEALTAVTIKASLLGCRLSKDEQEEPAASLLMVVRMDDLGSSEIMASHPRRLINTKYKKKNITRCFT